MSGPVIAQGVVYIGCSDGKLYALDAAEGHKKWDFETGSKNWATPAIDGETIYIGSFDKKLYALDANDGSKKWEFKTEGAIVSAPLVYNNTVYIGSLDRYLYALNAADGSLRWKFLAENWFWACPVIYNNTIYAPCLDGKVYILEAETGDEVVVAIDLGSPVSSSPVLVDDKVVIASEEGKVYALDTSNNQIKQLVFLREVDLGEKVYAPLYASSGVVYIHSQKHETLCAMRAETGVMLWTFSLSSK